MVFIVLAGIISAGGFALMAHQSWAGRSRLKRCRTLVASGENREAILQLGKLAATRRGDVEVHYLLATAYRQAGRWQDAAGELEVVETYNRQEKKYPPVQLAAEMADCYVAVQEYKNAQGVLLLALKHYPRELSLHLQIADLFMLRNMPKHAAEYLGLAIDLSPRDPALLEKMAHVMEETLDLRKALRYAKLTLELDRNRPAAVHIAARCYYHFRNYDEANAYYARLVQFPETVITGLTGRGECLLQSGNPSAALHLFRQALERTGEGSDASLDLLYRIGSLCIEQMEVVRGVEYFEKIAAQRRSYRDVNEKLEKYRDFRRSGALTRYAFSTNDDFYVLAVQMLQAAGMKSLKHKIVRKRDFVFYAVREDDEVREQVYFYFSRSLHPVTEWELRELVGEIRVLRMNRGVVFSPGGFDRPAAAYAESRPLALQDRERIERLLDAVVRPEPAVLAG